METEKNINPASESNAANENSAPKAKANIHNLIIVDESGSMSGLRNVTLSGVNETINTIRSAQEQYADTQNHSLTLVTFDSGNARGDVRTIIDDKPIGEVSDFTDYSPFGCTPLYDAMGDSITRLHERVKDDPHASVVVTVLTDGLENASTHWSAQMVRDLIERLKEEGWTFAYMGSAHNVKSVTDLLAIDNVMEFAHDQRGAHNTWSRERSSKEAYFRKMNQMYEEDRIHSIQELRSQRRTFANEYYMDRVTPEHITNLNPGEVFVFGSNQFGRHTGGAAGYALRHFGAVMGQAEGPQGQSYAIPTTGGIALLAEAVKRFINYATHNVHTFFYVTPIGCGNAGYTPEQIAPLFEPCLGHEHIALPAEFLEVLGLKMY